MLQDFNMTKEEKIFIQLKIWELYEYENNSYQLINDEQLKILAKLIVDELK
jgi:hypothetical protein